MVDDLHVNLAIGGCGDGHVSGEDHGLRIDDVEGTDIPHEVLIHAPRFLTSGVGLSADTRFTRIHREVLDHGIRDPIGIGVDGQRDIPGIGDAPGPGPFRGGEASEVLQDRAHIPRPDGILLQGGELRQGNVILAGALGEIRLVLTHGEAGHEDVQLDLGGGHDGIAGSIRPGGGEGEGEGTLGQRGGHTIPIEAAAMKNLDANQGDDPATIPLGGKHPDQAGGHHGHSGVVAGDLDVLDVRGPGIPDLEQVVLGGRDVPEIKASGHRIRLGLDLLDRSLGALDRSLGRGGIDGREAHRPGLGGRGVRGVVMNTPTSGEDGQGH